MLTVSASSYKGMAKAYVVNQTSSVEVMQDEEPSCCITANRRNLSQRVYLVEGDAGGKRAPTRSVGADPAFAIKTASGGRVHRAWLESGKVLRVNARCLARWQDLPDSYPLPERETLACTIIGNGVAGRLQRAIAQPLLQGIHASSDALRSTIGASEQHVRK